MAGKNTNKPNCYKCKYFFLTWKPQHPYGCKAFQMESKLLPARHVFLESRQECLYFEEKSKSSEDGEANKKLMG